MISDTNYSADSRVNAALHAAGSAVPPAGMEGRILTRLATERLQTGSAGVRLPRLGSLQRRAPRGALPALGFASAGLLAAVFVVGSVSYSHRSHRDVVPVAAPVQMPSQGVGAASAVHPAAPASSPVVAGSASRGRSVRHGKHGRARVGRHARTAPGVIVPVPAETPQN